jgi:predicted 2-oxoglutarate/Fe(II)-dependent dioxygenase YbiX/peroxiredoxin
VTNAPRVFSIGDPVPWFVGNTSANPQFHFSTIAGSYVVLSFLGSATNEKSASANRFACEELRPAFDDIKCTYFGVSIDPQDREQQRLLPTHHGIRYFWDFDQAISKAYGAIMKKGEQSNVVYRPFTLVLDPMLRVIANIPVSDVQTHNQQLKAIVMGLPDVSRHAGVDITAPVLVLPNVLEPKLCHELIALYNQQGGVESGFMREREGKTIAVMDYSFKRRKDFNFDDAPEYENLRDRLRKCVVQRMLPEIKKAFSFEATRIERYIVACYDSETKGFFRPHRDNTTKGTAHRRFACTINLNAEDFSGGELRFPEFGQRTYRAPTGGAVVFSCSLLHEATPVTSGTRYAFLPFLYDEAAAKIREANRSFLSGEVIDKNKPAA